MTDNKQYCKNIADELEQIASGELYISPITGDYITYADTLQCDEECEQVTMYDYFNDVYNIEYHIDGNGEYKSVELMVACGGPNIYVSTKSCAVELYWGSDQEIYRITSDAIEQINDVWEENFMCMR